MATEVMEGTEGMELAAEMEEMRAMEVGAVIVEQ